MEGRTTHTRSGSVTLREDGILCFRAASGVEHDEDKAIENIAALRQLARGMLLPVLVDMRETGAMTRAARQAYANADSAAQGLLVGSSFTRIIANVFLRIGRPGQPAKMFTSEEEAVQWLNGFLT